MCVLATPPLQPHHWGLSLWSPDEVWAKGRKIEGLDADVYRLDVAGALMKRDRYGKEGLLGWEVDHIYPKELLKKHKVEEVLWNDMRNLRPMNAKNNVSKGESYPEYTACVKCDMKKMANEEVKPFQCTVSEQVQLKLKALYNIK